MAARAAESGAGGPPPGAVARAPMCGEVRPDDDGQMTSSSDAFHLRNLASTLPDGECGGGGGAAARCHIADT